MLQNPINRRSSSSGIRCPVNLPADKDRATLSTQLTCRLRKRDLKQWCLKPERRRQLDLLMEARRRVAAVNTDLQQLGFDPPGTDLEAWLHLARIIEVDPSQMTAAELYQEALAWVDRTQIQEQIRQSLRRKGTGR